MTTNSLLCDVRHRNMIGSFSSRLRHSNESHLHSGMYFDLSFVTFLIFVPQNSNRAQFCWAHESCDKVQETNFWPVFAKALIILIASWPPILCEYMCNTRHFFRFYSLRWPTCITGFDFVDWDLGGTFRQYLCVQSWTAIASRKELFSKGNIVTGFIIKNWKHVVLNQCHFTC